MQKIEKHNGFFRKHYYRLFGLFYLIVAVAMFFTGESSSLMSYGYFAIGICYFVVQYFFGGSTEEYISWDEDKIVLKHWWTNKDDLQVWLKWPRDVDQNGELTTREWLAGISFDRVIGTVIVGRHDIRELLIDAELCEWVG